MTPITSFSQHPLSPKGKSFNGWGLLFCFLILLSSAPVQGQVPTLSPIEPSQRSGDLPEVDRRAEPLKPLPPTEEFLRQPKDQSAFPDQQLPNIRVSVEKIQVIGNTVLTEKELSTIIKPYLKKGVLVTEDLAKLRQALSLLYADKKYINSGVVIPDQTVKDGVLNIQVIEGKLSDIEFDPKAEPKHYLPFYLKDRLGRNMGWIPFSLNRPFNLNQLQQRLQYQLQDQRIKRLNAEIIPGTKRGVASLRVRVEERSPYGTWLEFNNFQNPSVGAERGLVTLQHLNPFGFGDMLRFQYGRSAGTDPLIDVFYESPFTPWDTKFQLRYRKTDFKVVEGNFDTLDIKLNTDIFGFILRQPVYQTPTEEFAVSFQFEHLRNKNSLLGQPFNFFEGSQNGEQIITALRFIQEWLDRDSDPPQVISVRSRFSVGIDALGATVNPEPIASGQFFAWLGQFSWGRQVQPVQNYPVQLLSRMDFQFTERDVFPLEEFAMGGRFTVRGYRENTLVRDNAFFFSFESRFPVWRTPLGQNIMQIASFVDVGRSWNTGRSSPRPETLASVGLGILAFAPQWPGSTFQVYWGQRLNHVQNPHDNLQDFGIHVQFTVQALPIPTYLEPSFQQVKQWFSEE